MLGLTCLSLFVLWKSAEVLDSLEARRSFRSKPLFHTQLLKSDESVNQTDSSGNTVNRNRPTRDRFLVYKAALFNQRIGASASGLLSAHLLGEEFGRIVCVHPVFETFLDVFEPIDPQTNAKCTPVLRKLYEGRRTGHIQVRSDRKPPDECLLQETLISGPDIVYMIGDTYPRWPEVPPKFFDRFYRPKPQLLALLPYNATPEIVVELTAPEGRKVKRLNSKELVAVGRLHPSNRSYLIAEDRVDLYRISKAKYGWSHPPWNQNHSFVEINGTIVDPGNQTVLLNRQKWVDWYTILQARKVLHQNSQLATSAIRWMGMESHSLLNRPVKGTAVRLGERDVPAASNNNSLLNCGVENDSEDFKQDGDTKEGKKDDDDSLVYYSVV